jgi:hypothetical protein
MPTAIGKPSSGISTGIPTNVLQLMLQDYYTTLLYIWRDLLNIAASNSY